MRFTKFVLPAWVATGLMAVSAATADDTSLSSRLDPNLYGQLAQNDAPVAAAPVLPAVPQEDAYQMRALPPQEAAQEASEEEGPTRYLEIEPLTSRGINTYGWVAAGLGANNWGSPFNGPITFNDRNWQGQMNQLYLVNERLLDVDNGRWLGGRVDLLYGTDYIYTTARGLDGNLFYQPNPAGTGGAPSWASSKDYGLAMPQLYGEVGAANHAVKFGHFYTIIGYEVVPAIGNFFYTHAYTMQYGEPFTHTGILDTWTPNDQLVVYGGITNGWDNFSDPINYFGINNPGYPGANSNAAFLGGVTFKNSDATQALTTCVSSGNEIGSFALDGTGNIGNRSIVSTVYINEFSDKLTYVFQNDLGWQFNANPAVQNIGQADGLAQWYGINQYMFYNISDTLVGGMRLEWFRDNNGTRVINPIRNAIWGGPYGAGYAGNFWQVTWGLNWKPNNNWIIRPELRYDWYSPDNMKGPLPFGKITNGSGDQYGQLYGGCDAIWQF